MSVLLNLLVCSILQELVGCFHTANISSTLVKFFFRKFVSSVGSKTMSTFDLSTVTYNAKMNEHEKEIIRRNRRFIQENVFNIDDVADLLYEKGILTLNNKELVAVSFFHMPLN